MPLTTQELLSNRRDGDSKCRAMAKASKRKLFPDPVVCEHDSIGWSSLRSPSRSRAPQQQGLKRDRDGRFSEESGLSILPAAVMVGDDGGSSAGSKKHPANSHQQQQQQQQRAPFTGSGEHFEASAPRSSSSSSVTRSDTCTARGNASTLAGGAHGYMSSGGGGGGRPAPTVRLDGGEHIGRHGGGINPSVNPLRSPSSGGLRSPAMAVMAGVGGASFPSRVSCWWFSLLSL